MTFPDYSSYKDINDDMLDTSLSIQLLKDSMQHKLLFVWLVFLTCRFIRYIRIVRTAKKYYLAASVFAEMKKAVTYRVDVCVDEHSVIREAQCECGAGQGPSAHCKHVAAVLYGFHSFHTDGSHMFNEQTSTQVI
jgi:hypothetical protein